MRTNTPKIVPDDRRSSYSRLQVGLHWAIAGLVLTQLVVNHDMRHAFGLRIVGQDAALSPGAVSHLVAGLAILALTLLRLAVRLWQGAPEPAQGAHPVIQAMGEWAHRGLYVLLLGTTLTGAAAWALHSETMATLHEIARLALVALIVGHVVGALVEHFMVGNRVIRRIVTPGAQARPVPAATLSATSGRDRSAIPDGGNNS